MKIIRKILPVIICVFLAIGGCGKHNNIKKWSKKEKLMDKVIKSQIASATPQSGNAEERMTDNAKLSKDISKGDNTTETKEADGKIDFDLTEMNSDMVYATVYQMMVAPDQYEGKTFRIDGTFYAAYDKKTKKHYYYCIVQDATECCAQGVEFVWGDGSHIYPDEYPAKNSEVIVDGTFETYKEKGDKKLYCRLSDAKMQVKKS